jgi:hypothetical protein
MFDNRNNSRWSRLLGDLQRRPLEKGANVEDSRFLETAREIDRVLTWGILNPLGPTVASLCLATDPSCKVRVIFVKISNAFSTSTVALGAVKADQSEGDLFGAILDSTTPAPGTSSRILQLAPTFVIPSENGELMCNVSTLIVFRNIQAAGTDIDLGSEIDRFKRFWLNPWGRLPSMGEMLSMARSQSSPAPPEISNTLFTEWWGLVSDPEHIFSEWGAIVEAWQGAIKLQGNSPMAKSAIPARQALVFHTRLINNPAIFLPK